MNSNLIALKYHLIECCRCYDHVDEVVAGRSVAFDALGQRLFVGLKNQLDIFDVSRPGRHPVTSRKTWTKKEGGQSGIISALAVISPAFI